MVSALFRVKSRDITLQRTFVLVWCHQRNRMFVLVDTYDFL